MSNTPNALPANATQDSPGTTQTNTQTAPVEESLSFNGKLNASDRYWKFKVALQSILIVAGYIGIGCTAWLIATAPVASNFGYGYDFYSPVWPSLLTFVLSVIWCAICLLAYVLRKKPVHPGTRVAVDLILWLGFIVTTLFAMAALSELTIWGNYGDLSGYGHYSSRGDYELASNGTWVWEQDESYISSPRSCNGSTNNSYNYRYSDYYYFKDCAEQDAYVNKLWQEKPHRVSIHLVGAICQFIGLTLHLALFIWACVDTHHHNRSKVSKDAEKIAAGIVQTMINNGAVVPPPGQAYMRPAVGQGMYYQLPPQQAYPMATMYPQQMPAQTQRAASGQHRAGASPTPGPVAGPSDEKSQGPRYA
ncbi:hypothetical protein BKA66DRAFT_404389 [Pyrenochaeta sp. MPI-SDFR-AT-0127]|nr:hypothetical protein BKA66DRAFT_404389 [Pyrenochaeta sp. MPI-SDFR-AT-0127]